MEKRTSLLFQVMHSHVIQFYPPPKNVDRYVVCHFEMEAFLYQGTFRYCSVVVILEASIVMCPPSIRDPKSLQ